VKTRIGSKSGHFAASLWILLTKLWGMSVEEGAATSVYLATSPDVQGATGKYFTKCKPKEPNALAYDSALRKKLWEVSEKLSGCFYT